MLISQIVSHSSFPPGRFSNDGLSAADLTEARDAAMKVALAAEVLVLDVSCTLIGRMLPDFSPHRLRQTNEQSITLPAVPASIISLSLLTSGLSCNGLRRVAALAPHRVIAVTGAVHSRGSHGSRGLADNSHPPDMHFPVSPSQTSRLQVSSFVVSSAETIPVYLFPSGFTPSDRCLVTIPCTILQ